MGVAERRDRDRIARERRIVAAARAIADAEGWAAVTIRRLAEEIEYSQPVIYSHFDGRDAIVAAVAVEGFRELAAALRRAAHCSTGNRAAVVAVAETYLAFAARRPALYEAMFTMPIGLRFAEAETRAELRDAFAALAEVVAPFRGDVDLATETLWAALHGLAELARSGRIRPAADHDRVGMVVEALLGP